MRLRTLSIVPIAIISMLAAGTSAASAATPQVPVNLGSAGNFTVLSQSGVTDVFKTTIDGNVGTSPITGAAIGLTCGEVNGIIYTVDAAGPLQCAVTDPTRLTAAVGEMPAVSTAAACRLCAAGPSPGPGARARRPRRPEHAH